MTRTGARDFKRHIRALGEKRRVTAAQGQTSAGQSHFGPAVNPARHQSLGRRLGKPRKVARTAVEINLAPIIRVNQTHIPEFRPLVEIRHAGRDQFDRKLR